MEIREGRNFGLKEKRQAICSLPVNDTIYYTSRVNEYVTGMKVLVPEYGLSQTTML